jgi:hypothetical protein
VNHVNTQKFQSLIQSTINILIYQYTYICNRRRCLTDGYKNCSYYEHKNPEENRKLQLKFLCFTCQRVKLPNHDMQKFQCDFPYVCCHNGKKRCKGYIKTVDGEINKSIVKRLSWGGCY